MLRQQRLPYGYHKVNSIDVSCWSAAREVREASRALEDPKRPARAGKPMQGDERKQGGSWTVSSAKAEQGKGGWNRQWWGREEDGAGHVRGGTGGGDKCQIPTLSQAWSTFLGPAWTCQQLSRSELAHSSCGLPWGDLQQLIIPYWIHTSILAKQFRYGLCTFTWK